VIIDYKNKNREDKLEIYTLKPFDVEL